MHDTYPACLFTIKELIRGTKWGHMAKAVFINFGFWICIEIVRIVHVFIIRFRVVICHIYYSHQTKLVSDHVRAHN